MRHRRRTCIRRNAKDWRGPSPDRSGLRLIIRIRRKHGAFASRSECCAGLLNHRAKRFIAAANRHGRSVDRTFGMTQPTQKIFRIRKTLAIERARGRIDRGIDPLLDFGVRNLSGRDFLNDGMSAWALAAAQFGKSVAMPLHPDLAKRRLGDAARDRAQFTMESVKRRQAPTQ